MPTITYEDRQITLSNQSNLLEGLERAGIEVPCSCSSGVCHGCMAQLLEGSVPATAQLGLSKNQRRLKYFLTCQCYPETDLRLTLASNIQERHTATLIDKRIVNSRVMVARFAANIDWQPGQHITLWKSPTRGRVYSIASSPDDGYVELHVRRRPNGLISHWLEHELSVGEECQFTTPAGDCYYSPAMPGQPILLVGTGTGIAPLYGILKQALAAGHHGKINFYAAAGEPQQLYLVDELRTLAQRHADFNYRPVVHRNNTSDSASNSIDNLLEGDLLDLIPRHHDNFRRHLVYLCGAPAMVETLKQQCFLNGALMEDIFTNTFTPGGINPT